MGKNTVKPIVVPSLAEANPTYAEMLQRRVYLENRRAQLEDDMSRIRRGKAPRHITEEDSSELTTASAALVADVVADAEDYRLPNSRLKAASVYETLQSELEAVNGALAILRAALPEAQAAATRKVIDSMRGDYDALLRQLAISVAAVIPLHDRYAECLLALRDEDVRYMGRLTQPENIGQVFGFGDGDLDRNSKARRFVRDCLSAGIVGAHELEAAGYVN